MARAPYAGPRSSYRGPQVMSTDMGLGVVHASDQTGHQHPAQRPSCYPVQLNSKAVV